MQNWIFERTNFLGQILHDIFSKWTFTKYQVVSAGNSEYVFYVLDYSVANVSETPRGEILKAFFRLKVLEEWVVYTEKDTYIDTQIGQQEYSIVHFII